MISPQRNKRLYLSFGLLIVAVPGLLGNTVSKKLPPQPVVVTGKIDASTAGELQLADNAAPAVVRKKLPPAPPPPAPQVVPAAVAPQPAAETAAAADETPKASEPSEAAPAVAAPAPEPVPAVAAAPPAPAAELQPESQPATLAGAKQALPALAQKAPSTQAPDSQRDTYPFSLLLSSCREKESAEAATHYFRRDGLVPYMVETELGGRGKWWRVLSGSYRSLEAALQAKKALNLSDAVVVKTPFANLIGELASEKEATEQSARHRRKGISTYLVKGPGQSVLLLVGAFPDRQTAEQYQRQLETEGIATQVIAR
jgi:septal ring-binding cell division protein DamX